MCLKIKLIITLLIYACTGVASTTYSTNATDLSKCKVHYSRAEAKYVQFFQITDNFRANASLVLDFHFALLAPRDAHILLSPSADIQQSDPIYEIVLGAGRNTFSDIRRLQKSNVKRSAKTKDLLSPLDVKSFWIHVSTDGLIEVGKEGEELAFLSWRDPDPLPLNVFSFCTWPGVEAKWYYDCQREDGSISDSKEIQRNLTNTEKLRKSVLEHYDPYKGPYYSSDEIVTIHMGLTFNRIHLDEMNSKIVLDGAALLQWLDSNIYWNSSDFENKEELYFRFREIWQPNLLIYNSASGPGNDFLKSNMVVVSSEGWVTMSGHVHMEAWCDASGLGHWPNDEHVCEVQLGFWPEEEHLLLNAYQNVSTTIQYSEWKLTGILSGFYLIPTPWNADQDHFGNTFVIKFAVRRASNAYTSVYFTPLFAISISLLVSFWLSPVGAYRITLHCIQLILLSFILTKLAINIPAHPTSTPNIVLLYSYGIAASLLALLFSIVLYNVYHTKHKKPLPYLIIRFLSLKYISLILYVRGSKFADAYDKLIDDNSSQTLDIQGMWTLLAIAVDRLLFITYFLFIIIFLSKQY